MTSHADWTFPFARARKPPAVQPYLRAEITAPQVTPPASVGRRFLAYLVDLALLLLVAGLGWLGASAVTDGALPIVVAIVLSLAYAVAVWAWEGSTGKTPGNVVARIMTVDAYDHHPLGFRRAALRWLVVGLGTLAFGIGQVVVVLSPAFDVRRLGWQDRAAGATVIDAPTDRQAASPITTAPGAPVSAPRAQPVVPRRPAPPVTAEEDLDMTRRAGDVASIRLTPPAVVPVEIELDSGERYVVAGPTLIGRDPRSPDDSAWTLISMEDRTMSVSKTHLEMGIDSGGFWIRDRNSTNGTVVSTPTAPPQVAEPGARVRVPMGSTVHVGDRKLVVRASTA